MSAVRRTESRERRTETRDAGFRSGGALAPQRRVERVRNAILSALAICAVLLTACGDNDDGAGEPTHVIDQNNGTPVDSTRVSDENTATVTEPPLIVYEANIADNVDVFTIDPATGETLQLTSGEKFDGSPAWSRDRQRILFTSSRDDAANNNDLYTMAPDGTDVQRLTSTPNGSEFSAKYSHDGDTIGYSIREDGDYYIEVMDADGSNVRRLTEAYDFAEFPAWRPGDDELFYMAIGEGTQAGDIHAVNVETLAVRTIISTPGADVCPHFTHDGDYVTYARSPLDDPEGEQDIFRHELTDTDTTGTNDVALTDDLARDDYASFSPDGTTVVFLSARVNEFDLWLMDPDGSNQRILTDTPDARENVPDW